MSESIEYTWRWKTFLSIQVSRKAEQPLRGMELQEEEAQKG